MGSSKQRTGELVRGTLDMLVLKALTPGPMHGYAVAEFIERTSKSILQVEEGALYPALHRLELRGLLASRWSVSENNRRAKFYRLTQAGEQRLAAESERWTHLTGGIRLVMESD